jgi:uncharacterized iron-regulated membrane protein
MHPALRRLWLKLHRWTALSLGWLLALSALLGSALTVAKPLDQWAHPELFVQTSPSPAGSARLEGLRQELQREFGPKASYTFRPPRQAEDTLWVFVRGPWEGTVFFDAATGRELGRRGEHEGFYNLLFELHSSLLLGDTGKAALTICALAYLLLLASGLVLWWPARWPPSFRIRWGAGALRSIFDLHNVGGALLGMAVAVSVVSGAYMAWPPLRTFVSGLAGATPVTPPVVPATTGPAKASLDELVSRAQDAFPGAMVGYVQAPSQANSPVRVRLKLADDVHPNGLTSVWLHPVSAEVLAVRRWNQLDAGHRAVSVIYPLHTGELGGPVLTVVVGLLGLTLGFLGLSGLWLWWKRRRARADTGSARGHPKASGGNSNLAEQVARKFRLK